MDESQQEEVKKNFHDWILLLKYTNGWRVYRENYHQHREFWQNKLKQSNSVQFRYFSRLTKLFLDAIRQTDSLIVSYLILISNDLFKEEEFCKLFRSKNISDVQKKLVYFQTQCFHLCFFLEQFDYQRQQFLTYFVYLRFEGWSQFALLKRSTQTIFHLNEPLFCLIKRAVQLVKNMGILTSCPHQISVGRRNSQIKNLTIAVINVRPPLFSSSSEAIADTINGKIELIISLFSFLFFYQFFQFFNNMVCFGTERSSKSSYILVGVICYSNYLCLALFQLFIYFAQLLLKFLSLSLNYLNVFFLSVSTLLGCYLIFQLFFSFLVDIGVMF